MTDQARVLRQMARRAERKRSSGGSGLRVITVTSGKDGVGKTNLSVNLGITLVKSGLRVALVDADIGLANVDIALGIDPKYTLRHVLFEGLPLEDVIVPGPGGLQIVAGGSGVRELIGMDEPRLQRFVDILSAMDADFDVVLIDTGAGVGPHVLSFALSSPETIAVITPEPSSIADAYAVVKAVTFQRRDIRWHIAVNMVRSKEEGRQTFARFAAVSRRFLNIEPEFLGAVPRDDAVVRAIQGQRPFVLQFPRTPAARAVGDMSRRLTNTPQPQARGIGEFVQRLLRLRG